MFGTEVYKNAAPLVTLDMSSVTKGKGGLGIHHFFLKGSDIFFLLDQKNKDGNETYKRNRKIGWLKRKQELFTFKG